MHIQVPCVRLRRPGNFVTFVQACRRACNCVQLCASVWARSVQVCAVCACCVRAEIRHGAWGAKKSICMNWAPSYYHIRPALGPSARHRTAPQSRRLDHDWPHHYGSPSLGSPKPPGRLACLASHSESGRALGKRAHLLGASSPKCGAATFQTISTPERANRELSARLAQTAS